MANVMEIFHKITDYYQNHQSLFGKENTENHLLEKRLTELYQEICLPEELSQQGILSGAFSEDDKPVLLRDWQVARRDAMRMGEPLDAQVLQHLADLADQLALPPYRIPVFVPDCFAVCSDGRLCVNWLQLAGLRLRTKQRALESHQRAMRYVLHPLWTREIPHDLDDYLSAAMRYSFALFLLDSLTTQGTVFLQKQALDKLRSGDPDLPPEIIPMLSEVLQTGPLPSGVQQGCRKLWQNIQEALLYRKTLETRQPSLHLLAYKESYATSGRYKRGAMQDAELTCPELPESLMLVGVADGVSTADLGSGEIATREIARVFEDFCLQHAMRFADPTVWPEGTKTMLGELFEEANQAVVARWNFLLHNRTRQQDVKMPMSSTLLAAAILGDTAVIAWVGDSVAWHYQAQTHRLIRLTFPHHLATEQMQHGEFSCLEQSEAQHADLSRLIGQGVWLEDVGNYQPEPLQVDFVIQSFAPGDLLLLASDGLAECLYTAGDLERDAELAREIRSHLSSRDDLQQMVCHLVEVANEQQGHDNITAVVVYFELHQKY